MVGPIVSDFLMKGTPSLANFSTVLPPGLLPQPIPLTIPLSATIPVPWRLPADGSLALVELALVPVVEQRKAPERLWALISPGVPQFWYPE